MKNAILTFDVEKTYRTTRNVSKVTSFLDEIGVKGTLFVTADLLDEEIDDLRNAQAGGHEIASHGCDHPYVYDRGWLQKTERLIDKAHIADYVRRSYEVFLNLDFKVRGFRTIGFRTSPLLMSEVSKYFDYYSGRGRRIQVVENHLVEIPISRVFMSLSFHPAMLLYTPVRILAQCLQKAREPVVLYFHSFDLMKKSLALTFYASLWKRVLYYNRTGPILRKKMRQLANILKNQGYEFITCDEFYRKLLQ